MFQRRKKIIASWDLRPNGAKPKVVNEHKRLNFKQKAQKKTKPFRTNPKGPKKIWVPKSEILDVVDMLKRKGKAEVMVLGQWLLTTHAGEKCMFPTLEMKEGRTVGFGGNQTGKIIGIGTIGNSSIFINNVWFVDGLRHNLLSIIQFSDNGYEVMFDKSSCTVINKNDQVHSAQK